MKKLLIVLLALAMVFGLATTAFAYTDQANQDSAAVDSSYYLTALGVVNGYPDGSYGYDKTITRAEFAKIACGIAGLTDSADALANTSSRYADVAAGQWYTGCVNLATAQGYLQGYPDGKFKPNANITQQEVATVLLRLAGYDDNLSGSWPYDYIAQAGKVGLTDDITFVANAAATRATVAVMSTNLLDCEVMYWDTDKDRFVEVDGDADADYAVLADSFGATTADDVYLGNGADSADAAWTVNDFDDMSLGLYVYENIADAAAGANLDTVDLADDYYISGGLSLADLANAKADLVYNEDDEVIYIGVKSTTAISDDVEITATLDDATDAASDVSVSIDGKKYGLADDMDAYTDFFDAQLGATDGDYESAMDYIVYYTNEDGDVYSISDMTGYTCLAGEEPAIVDEYNAAKETITMLNGDDIDLDGQDYLIIKNGQFVDASTLKQGDVVSNLNLDVAGYEGDVDLILTVSGLATGSLTKATSSTVTIGGYAYDYDANTAYATDGVDGTYATLAAAADLESLFGTDVSYVTYANPYVLAYIIGTADAASDYVYGIVTDYTAGSHTTDINSITVYNQDGETVEYDLDDSYAAETFDGDEILAGAYVEFKLNADGEVSNFDAEGAIINPADVTGDITDADNISGSKIKVDGKWYTLADDAIIMEAVSVAGDGAIADWADYDDANVLAADDILGSDEFAAEGYYVAKITGSNTITRLYVVDSSLGGGEEYGVISDIYYNGGDADMYEILGDAAYELDSNIPAADVNDFVAYEAAAKITFNQIIASFGDDFGVEVAALPGDLNWVDADGALDTTADSDADVALEVAVDGDVVTVADDVYYYLTDSTVVYNVDENGDVTVGDINDVDDGSTILALVDIDDESDLLYVFVLDADYLS